MDDNNKPRQQPMEYDPDPNKDFPWLLLSIIIAAGLIAGAFKAFGWW